MCRRISLRLALLSATASVAAAQNFLLGVKYSERVAPGSLIEVMSLSAATDSSGNIYILADGVISQPQNGAETPYILKLTPTGDLVYQTMLPFQAFGMAVDPAGDVYVTGYGTSDAFVEKLSTDGKTVLYQTVIGKIGEVALSSIAVDYTGRAYITGGASPGAIRTTPGAFQQTAIQAFVVRLKASGSVDYATYLGGSNLNLATGIAVDASGSAFVTGVTASADFPITPGAYLTAPPAAEATQSFLTRLNADGSGLIYSTFTDTQGNQAQNVAVDPADNASVVLMRAGVPGLVVMRFNSAGRVAFSKTLPPATSLTGLAVDGAGDTYVTAFAGNANYPVKHSLTPCESTGSAALSVFDGNGNVLQSTYLAGVSRNFNASLALAVLPDTTVNLVGLPDATYKPTQQLTGSSSGILFLTRLSQDRYAQPTQLACVGNSGSFDSSAISAGELVSFFGEGLGPATGTQPQVTIETGFPVQLANVKVTFNGIPGPLLYVQDSQINAIAPWSLQTGQFVEVCVAYNGAGTNCLARPVVEAHPGVFTVDGNYAAALNQDGTVNSASNPAKANSIVSIFATGLGPVIPAQSDGAVVGFPLPVNMLPVEMSTVVGPIPPVFIPTTVLYAGPAPFEVAGVSQINFIAAPDGSVQVGQTGSNVIQVHIAP